MSWLPRWLKFAPAPSDVDPLPVYMHPVERAQLRAITEAVAPRSVLEWGSGGSTREFLRACPFIERLVSVEHDPEWYERVTQLIHDPRLSLHLVPATEPAPSRQVEAASPGFTAAWAMRGEQFPELFADYVSFPSTLGIRFDFVLVDGRARVFCLERGLALLETGGVLVLHDAQRAEYQDAIAALGQRATFLEPWHQGQICLVKKCSPA